MTAAARPAAPPTVTPPAPLWPSSFTVLRLTGWLPMLGLAIAGMNSTIVLFALLLILPGIVLLLAPNVVLYGAPLELALVVGHVVGRLTGRRPAGFVAGLAAAAAFLAPLVVIPRISQARTDREVAALQAGDFDRSGGPAPASVALFGDGPGDGCGEVCRTLLAERRYREVYVLAHDGDAPDIGLRSGVQVYSLAADPQCQSLTGDRLGGSCLHGEAASPPPVDMVISSTLTFNRDLEGKPRMDALDTGLRSVTRLQVWRCTAGACTETRRGTSVRTNRLAPVLVVYTDADDYGMELHRDWMRFPNEFRPVKLLDVAQQLTAGAQAQAGPPAPDAQSTAESLIAAAARDGLGLDERGQVAFEAALSNAWRSKNRPALARLIVPFLGFPTSGASPAYITEGIALLSPRDLAPHAHELARDFDAASRDGDRQRIVFTALVMSHLSAASIRAEGRALMSVLAYGREPRNDAGPLWSRLAELGAPALPAFRAGLEDRPKRPEVALGVCRLGAAATPLVPLLAAQLDRRNDPFDRVNPQQAASLALLRLGRRDLVEAYLTRDYPTVPVWYRDRLASVGPGSPPDACA